MNSIKIDNNNIVIFVKKPPNYVDDLFENNDKIRSWNDLRAKLDLDGNKNFYWRQNIHTVPRAWIEMFLEW